MQQPPAGLAAIPPPMTMGYAFTATPGGVMQQASAGVGGVEVGAPPPHHLRVQYQLPQHQYQYQQSMSMSGDPQQEQPQGYVSTIFPPAGHPPQGWPG